MKSAFTKVPTCQISKLSLSVKKNFKSFELKQVLPVATYLVKKFKLISCRLLLSTQFYFNVTTGFVVTAFND